MLTTTKQNKLFEALKKYSKKYLNGKIVELDESGTRLMINEFLSDVLGYLPIEEIKTEYMIKGTYADYVIQLKGTRHFLVEVKALSLNLSESHLRQAVNYGANEGIEWVLLTNGRVFQLYKIILNKSVESRRIFSVDFGDLKQVKADLDLIQYLHKDCVSNKGLPHLWNKCSALDPANVAGYLYSPVVMNFIRKALKEKYDHKFSEEEVRSSIDKIVLESIALDLIKHVKAKKAKVASKPVEPENKTEVVVQMAEDSPNSPAPEFLN